MPNQSAECFWDTFTFCRMLSEILTACIARKVQNVQHIFAFGVAMPNPSRAKNANVKVRERNIRLLRA